MNEQRWHTAFENSAIGVMMVDSTGLYFAANRAFQNMLGYTEAELCHLTFGDVTYEEDRNANEELVRELIEGKRQYFEIEKRYRRKDGTLVWARTHATLFQGSGAPFWCGAVEDISGRRRAEEDLRKSQARLQTLLSLLSNNPNVTFLKDRQGRYLYVNKEFQRALCITEEQILGRKDDDVFPPEQAAAFQTNDRQVFQAGVPMTFEEVAQQEDGPHTAIVQKFPLFDAEGEMCAIGGIVTDITERKRAEKELLALRDALAGELAAMTRLHEFSTHLLAISDFQSVLEEVLDATMALQKADFGNVQLYNPETQVLEIVAQRGFQPDFLEHFIAVREVGTACGRAMALRERVIIEDVETDFAFTPHRSIAASAGFRAVQSTPLVSRGGELLGMLSTHFRRPHRPSARDLRFTDLYARQATEIIERQRLEAARRQSEEQYRNAQAELARVSRLTTMGELAASIAHEINQPLTAVANNSNACLRLLADGKLEPEVLRRALEDITADATRASTVIARIRSLIKKTPAQRSKLDVNDVIQEVVVLTGRECAENRVLLACQLTPLPAVVGDRVQLQQVLLNLIVNAIEAMARVTDRRRLLTVQSQVDESGNVLVRVFDSGTGLDHALDRFFTPFFTTKTSGMGMGLPISRSLIESHGGRLWGAPNSPHGAVFCFTLPAADGSSL